MENIPQDIQDEAEEYCKNNKRFGDMHRAYTVGRVTERAYQQQQVEKLLNWIMEQGYEWSNWPGKGPYWFSGPQGGRLTSNELIQIWKADATNQEGNQTSTTEE